MRKWLDGLGSRSLYTTMTIDSPSLIVAATRGFGSAMPLMLLDVDHADVVMFVGTNPVTSHFMSMPQPDPRRRLRDPGRTRRGGGPLLRDRRGGLTHHAGTVNFPLPTFDGPVTIPPYVGPVSPRPAGR